MNSSAILPSSGSTGLAVPRGAGERRGSSCVDLPWKPTFKPEARRPAQPHALGKDIH